MKRMTSWNEDCVQINGHALGYATKCELVQMAECLAAYEDTGLTTEEIKAALPEDVVIKLAAQALGTAPGRLRELAEVDRLVQEMEWRSDKYINYTAAREKACKGCTSRDGTEGCYSMEPCERLIAEIICAPAANVAPAERAMEGRKDGD